MKQYASDSNPPPETSTHQNTPQGFSAVLQSSLIRALYDDEGLGRLAAILADDLNGCAVVCDGNGGTLAVAASDQLDIKQKSRLLQHIPLRQSSKTNNGKNPAAGSMESNAALNNSRLQSQAVGDDIPIYRHEEPLVFGGENAGALIVLRLNTPFSQEEIQSCAIAASLLCVQLSQDKKIAEIELRLKGNFVEDLVSSMYSDPESILHRARALDYDIQTPHRVMVGVIDNLEQLTHHYANDQKAAGRLRTDLVQLIQGRLNQTMPGMVIFKKDELILLVQQHKADGDIAEFKTLAEKIINDATEQFKAKLYIGIGSTCRELSEFSKSYLEAKKSLEIGEYMITEGQIRSFEQFKVHALFLSTLKPAELYNYAREQLEALLMYDEKHKTDFLKTLQEFLYLRNNVEGTAKTINMSVSGLKYRLQKIEKILGHDLKDYKVCFDLQLALVILQLFGEYRIKQPLS